MKGHLQRCLFMLFIHVKKWWRGLTLPGAVEKRRGGKSSQKTKKKREQTWVHLCTQFPCPFMMVSSLSSLSVHLHVMVSERGMLEERGGASLHPLFWSFCDCVVP